MLLSKAQTVYLKTQSHWGGGKGENVHLSLAEQYRGTSKRSAFRAEESTGSYKLLINVG